MSVFRFPRRSAVQSLCFVGVIWLGVVSPARAQILPYKFVKIADTVTNPDAHINGLYCVGLNNDGMVVIKNTINGLWRGNGGALELVASGVAGICPSINDLGEIAYLSSAGGIATLVRNLNGAITTLATQTTAPFLYAPVTYLPSLANNGNALASTDGGRSIHIVPTAVALYDPDIHPPLFSFTSPASMNDSEQGVFAGSDAAGAAIFQNGGVAFLRHGQAVSGGTLAITSLQRPLINNAGRVAFLGRLDPPGTTGASGVYTSADGVNVALAGASPIGGRFSLNNSGHVAYRRTFSSPRTGVYVGRPGAVDQPVIPENGNIDGTTLFDGFVWEESLNDYGQIAFWAHLADGRLGVYRADPHWLKSLSFATKIPGCGPVNGKVTLNAPAPPGGLTVTLESDNAAASVPPTFVVPAGKTAATFKITPTPVLAKTVGAIQATVGPQSLERTLTVRPIGMKTLTLAPNPVTGGGEVIGTATLDCAAAPNDIAVTLSTSNQAVAQPAVPSLLFVVGTKTLNFSVNTFAVTASASATIKASGGGVSKSKKLTVNP